MYPLIILVILFGAVSWFLAIVACFKELPCCARNQSRQSFNGQSVRRVDTSSILRDCQIIQSSDDATKNSEFAGCKIYVNNSICAICMEDFPEGGELVLCPCKHCYHHHCIKEWLRLKNCCPICKLNICSGPHATESTPLLHTVWSFVVYHMKCF